MVSTTHLDTASFDMVDIGQWRCAIGTFRPRGLDSRGPRVPDYSDLLVLTLSLVSVVVLLLVMAGVERHPGPRTNEDTLIWLKQISSKPLREGLEAAIKFFGYFEGDHKTFSSWKDTFVSEHKSIKQEAHRRLMKQCGGTGKHGDVPPEDYYPSENITFVTEENECKKCEETFNSSSDLKTHVKTEHKEVIKKLYSKDALDNLVCDEKYKAWLESHTEVNTKEEKKMNALQDANKFLTNRANLEHNNIYKKVKESDGIIETQRVTYTTKEDGTVKKAIVTEQFANVTRKKRKSGDAENINPETDKVTGSGQKKQADKVSHVLQHIAGESMESRSALVAKLVDKEGPEFAASVMTHSKELKQQKKFTPAQTAAIISGTSSSDRTFEQLRTGFNKTFGSNPFASRHKVEEARQETLPVSKDDWNVSYEELYKNKQGENVNLKKKTCILSVKDLLSYIQKMAVAESENLDNLKDMDELQVCYDGDGGGGRFVAEFAFLNNSDRKIKLHPFMLYEGTDCRENLEVTIGKLTPMFRAIEGAIIHVEGKQLKITQYGVFDLCALNCILGKQNHSATYFDAWTDCRLDHIKKHKGSTHTPDTCKEISFLSLESLDKSYTHHSVKSGATRATGKHFESVIADNLIPLQGIFRYIPPLMHIIMGLGNVVFNELKRVAIDLDTSENNVHSEHLIEVQQQLKDLHDEKETLNVIHANYSLDKMILLNDIQRAHLVYQGKNREAETIASENYDNKRARKKKKANCDSELCVIFPIDEENGYDEKIKCENGCEYHVRCEGIALLDGEEIPISYLCKKCEGRGSSREWFKETLNNGALLFTDKINKINTQLTRLKIKI